ncbi:MAG: VWA domain-containing protein, partial [Planctomycetes bacterium]|nr:VWA domain-containing protein [Planctomycetota bacterium]
MSLDTLGIAPVFAKLAFDWPEGVLEWTLYVVAFLVAVVLAIVVYLRDARRISPIAKAWMLFLRLAVFAALIVIALNPHDREFRISFSPSRVIVLIDRSLSMALPEKAPASDQKPDSVARIRERHQAVAAFLAESPMIEQLRKKHELSFYTFNSRLEKDFQLIPYTGKGATGVRSDATDSAGTPGKIPLTAAGWQRFVDPNPIKSTGTSNGDPEPDRSADQGQGSTNETRLKEALDKLVREKSGKTLSAIVVISDGQWHNERESDSANFFAKENGVKIVSVGIGRLTRPANVRLHAINVPTEVNKGSPAFDLTANLQAIGMTGKEFVVKLYVKPAEAPDSKLKLAAETKTVILRKLKSEDDDAATAVIKKKKPTRKLTPAEQTAADRKEKETRANEASTAMVTFKLTPEQKKGRYEYVTRIWPRDRGKTKPKNAQPAPPLHSKRKTVTVVEENLGVLIIASGPMREYRFARNLLFRLKGVDVDVWLQTVSESQLKMISQDADDLMSKFPPNFPSRSKSLDEIKQDEDEAFAEGDTSKKSRKYDVVIAFDPDWTSLGFGGDGLKKLAKWVSKKKGGLIVVAGDVNTPNLALETDDPKSSLKLVLNMYPVILNLAAFVGDDSAGGTKRRKIELNRDGRGKAFLQLGESDSELDTKKFWDDFKGIYRCYPTKGRKAAATVFAEFGDKFSGGDFGRPILF